MADAQRKETKPDIGMADVTRAAWRGLKSTQTTLYLLVALAVASVVGVLVPQGASPDAYVEKLGPILGSLVVRAGLDHLFSSWWYLLILALLTISSGACAKRIWRLSRDLARGPSLALLQRKLQAGPQVGETTALAGEPEQVLDHLAQRLRRRWYRVVTSTDEAGARWLVGRKHGWAAYGLVLSHLAIFSIALGAILGVWPGVALDKPVQLTEGDTYTDPEGSFPFSLRLNSFSLERYPDGMTVKAYKSDVSVLEGDREVKRQVILVNHPLSYGHIQFYQSDYGIGGFAVKVTPPQGEPQELRFPVEVVACGEGGGSMYDIPSDGAVQFTTGKQAALVARGFSPDGPGNACPMPGATGGGSHQAAAQVTLVSGFGKGGDHSFQEVGWLTQGQPVKAGDYTLELEPVRYYSGLTARRDYGVPLVWLGFAVLCLGLMATFYFRPHSLVARISATKAGSRVRTAALEKGGAGGERWRITSHPLVGQVLEQLTQRDAAQTESAREERGEDD